MDAVPVPGRLAKAARRWSGPLFALAVAAAALSYVVPVGANWDCWSTCRGEYTEYGWTEICEVYCEWWDFPDPPPEDDPVQEKPPEGQHPDPNGHDSNGDGWANCAWLVVDGTTHWRGSRKEHPDCGNFHDTCTGRSQPHQGVDFPAHLGDPARSLTYGTVSEVGYSAANGNFVRVAHPDGHVTSYIHLQSTSVNRLATVYPATQIGTVNCTGNCDGGNHHVHVQVRPPAINGQQQPPINPYAKLGAC